MSVSRDSGMGVWEESGREGQRVEVEVEEPEQSMGSGGQRWAAVGGSESRAVGSSGQQWEVGGVGKCGRAAMEGRSMLVTDIESGVPSSSTPGRLVLDAAALVAPAKPSLALVCMGQQKQCPRLHQTPGRGCYLGAQQRPVVELRNAANQSGHRLISCWVRICCDAPCDGMLRCSDGMCCWMCCWMCYWLVG